MNQFWAKAAFYLIAICTFSSCVSSSKFSDLKKQNLYLQEEMVKLRQDQDELTNAQSKNQELNLQVEQAEDLLKELNAKYTGIKYSYEQLQADYDKLGAQNNNILTASSSEKVALESELAKKQDMLDQKEKILKEKQLEVQLKVDEIAMLNADLQNQKNELTSMKTRISEALSSFTNEDLQVIQKANGQVYVSLSQKLLFKKGSDQVDPKGRDAIQKLGVILKDYKLNIIVEGHTDSDGSIYKNWDLSVSRSTEVVKILQHAGVNPRQLIASGRAFYMPVEENTTEENKTLNRRTEIIISPNLEKIFSLINKY